MDADWTLELLSDSVEVVSQLLAEPMDDLRGLAAEVTAYRDRIHAEARPMTDIDLADRLATANLALLRHVDGAAAADQRLAWVAARYFVREDDGDSDLASWFGFDDDLEVFNAAAARVAPGLVLAA